MRKRLRDSLLTRFDGAVYYGVHFDYIYMPLYSVATRGHGKRRHANDPFYPAPIDSCPYASFNLSIVHLNLELATPERVRIFSENGVLLELLEKLSILKCQTQNLHSIPNHCKRVLSTRQSQDKTRGPRDSARGSSQTNEGCKFTSPPPGHGANPMPGARYTPLPQSPQDSTTASPYPFLAD
ncbi:hypothetical protein EVAR_45886_1 [Eumeta japonica]|uniref:Uncharacterized protein n=1 Tax=Eumeta variegata TaxID=151549 RepID=A0A4C1XPV9_EUMVA|nr:hypothetical protein EVAR_45886_1 [Eumeta japonica]